MTHFRSKNDEPLIVGILNVTPDSFSDGGEYLKSDVAVEKALLMIKEGADIIDIGGESTRPDSHFVSVQQELDRVIPVIEQLSKKTDRLISVDTTKPEVASEAVSVGAGMINDVSMLRDGIELAQIAASTGCELLLMHSRGTPETMKLKAVYDDVVEDVTEELKTATSRAIEVGVLKDKIWIDPGIGFAKNENQSVELIAGLNNLVQLGYPVLVGPSRKSFIGAFTGTTSDNRLGGTLASVTASVLNGARALRVHDVAHAKQAVIMASQFKNKVRV